MTTWLITYPQLRLFLDGMLTMMAVYALLSFAQHRKAIYWQYALYIGAILCTFRLIDQEYANPAYRPGDRFVIVLMESLALMLYLRFATLLMDLRRHDRLSYRVATALLYLLGGHLLLDATLALGGAPYPAMRSGLYVASRLMLAVAGFFVVPRIVRLRQAIIPYFVVGSLCFAVGCTVALAINFLPAVFTRQSEQPFSFPITYMQIGVVLEVLCFTLGISMRNRQLEQAQLATQAKLIEQLRENERRQQELQRIRADIARDLHDDMGGDLSSISLLSQAAAREVAARPEEARALLRLIGESARQVLANMRQIVWSLRTPTDAGEVLPQQEPLDCRLRETAYALFEHQPTQLHLNLPTPSRIFRLPADLCRELYLIHKELLHNVVRHAAARSVYVSLTITDTYLRLLVSDDGVGFTLTHVPADSNGLSGLRQRAVDLGGELLIQTKPGRGTTCTFEVALQPEPVEVAEAVA